MHFRNWRRSHPFAFHQKSVIGPPTLNLGCLDNRATNLAYSVFLGLLFVFGNQLWIFDWGVGAVVGRSAALRSRFYDGLAEKVEHDFILSCLSPGKHT